jgi:hypothetical protein
MTRVGGKNQELVVEGKKQGLIMVEKISRE